MNSRIRAGNIRENLTADLIKTPRNSLRGVFIYFSDRKICCLTYLVYVWNSKGNVYFGEPLTFFLDSLWLFVGFGKKVVGFYSRLCIVAKSINWSFLFLCCSFLRAFASICRILSLVTPIISPTSSSVNGP